MTVKYITIIFLCALSIALILPVTGICSALEPITSRVYITAIAGDKDVQVLKVSTIGWAQAEVGMVLSEGDRIKTGANSGASIKYDDGAVIDIASSANLVLAQLRDSSNSGKKQNKLVLESGIMHGLFEKVAPGEASRFEIKTPTAVCGVLGTKIYIDTTTNTVYVLEGSLTVVNMETGESYTVDAGNSIAINTDGSTSGSQPYSDAEIQEVAGQFEAIEIDILGYTPPADTTDPNAVIQFTPEVEEPASKV
jgi:hypothetical protein